MQRDGATERRSDGGGAGAWLLLRFVNLVALLGFGASAATVLAFAGPWSWALDLATHFRVQYCAGLLAAVVVTALARRRRLAVLFAAACLVNLAAIVPLYLPRAAVVANGSGAELTFLQINVRTSNTRYDLVAAQIADVDPDVLVLQELDPAWAQGLAKTLAAFPHAIVRIRRDNFGIGVFSRVPMTGGIDDIGDSLLPSVVARLETESAAFTLLATHPLPPKGRDYSGRRDRQLAAVGARVAGTHGPIIVLGDLNATPWSTPFRALLRDTGLRDASDGRGIHATWPANFPLMLIPIDHFLYSDGVAVIDERVGRDVGSDHYPLIVRARIVG